MIGLVMMGLAVVIMLMSLSSTLQRIAKALERMLDILRDRQ